MATGLQTTTDIRLPKTRVSLSISGYQIIAIARTVRILTTEVGWAIYRINLTTGEVDWAKDTDGFPTDDYVFTAVDIHSRNFNE